MTPVVVIVMVFVVPVAFMVVPAVWIAVIVRVIPIRTLIRRTLPHAWRPYIAPTVHSPITVDPGISRTRHRRPRLIPERRRGSSDGDTDLRHRRRSAGCKGGEGECHCKQLRFPVSSYVQSSLLRLHTRRMLKPHVAKKSRVYFFSSGTSNCITLRATTPLPFAVACVRSACIIPCTPYTSFSRKGSIGTWYFCATTT